MADSKSYEAMLELIEDIFFEYSPADKTVEVFNAASTRLSPGVLSFEGFFDLLRSLTGEDDILALNTLRTHLSEKTPSFTVKLTENLFNEDSSISGTLIQGRRIRAAGGRELIVGRIHPLHVRGAVNTITYDALTGLVSKMDIEALGRKFIDIKHRENTTVAILDIDYFKNVNDTYGHSFGDEVLRTVARIMNDAIEGCGTAGRIGGDEFLIIFEDADEAKLRQILHDVKADFSKAFPTQGPQGDRPISLSIGTSTYPFNAKTYEDCFAVADYCLYLAKEKGRNRFIIYTPGKHPSIDDIRSMKNVRSTIVNGRDNLPLGDVLAQMQFLIKYKTPPKLTALLTEFSERFRLPLVMLYLRDDRKLLESVGPLVNENDLVDSMSDAIFDPSLRVRLERDAGITVCNNILHAPEGYEEICDRLKEADIKSYLIVPFEDAAGKKADLLFVSVHDNLIWNNQHFMYYRLFADALSAYTL